MKKVGKTKVSGCGLASGFYDGIFASQLLLKKAYAEALRRFGNLPGVCGVGIGRRFLESEGRYHEKKSASNGYCIKVLVRHKQKPSKLKKREKIPCWIGVGGRPRKRVEVDVVSVAGIKSRKPGRLGEARGKPTAGVVDVGRTFEFTRTTVVEQDLTPGFIPPQPKLGTVGAIVWTKNRTTFHAVSASHVVLEFCAGNLNAPADGRAVNVSDSDWYFVPANAYRPRTVQVASCIRDALSFKIPVSVRPPSVQWPDGFTGELATPADIDRAILSDRASGFVWVERRGSQRSRMIPVDLEMMVDPATLPVDCAGVEQAMGFAQVWRMRFIPDPNKPEEDQTTLGGDSGAAVFLWAENNSDCRLLGFHIYETPEQTHTYATDAKWFLLQAFGPGLGSDYFLKV
jgi:hypothetical protein